MKTVLITGGTRGIGKAIAHIFAQNNFNLILNYLKNDNNAKKLKETLEKEYKIEILLLKCDISKEKEVQKMFQKIKKLDVLVNNAGISMDCPYTEKTANSFNKVLKTNLVGTFLVTKYASLIMEKGTIINISSNNSIDANYPESMDYDASKAGINSLTKNFVLALAPNIRVNAVLPGWVDTDMNKEMDLNFKKAEEDKILLNRFAKPNEIAEVVYFLASEKASYINGSIIRVDGGRK
jgi:3-oxoacyl-[acyl-carrier protein] reductase